VSANGPSGAEHTQGDFLVGFLDDAKDKLTEAAGNGQLDGAIDKAAEVADEKTGGKYGDQIDSAADKAKDALGNL
jgi:hypothetical protein